jgi:hypothetical protein
MEPEAKRQKTQPHKVMMLIEPVRILHGAWSRPLEFAFDFLDVLIEPENVTQIKNNAIHLYFCNWLLERAVPKDVEPAVSYIASTAKSMCDPHDGNEMSAQMVGEIKEWIAKRQAEIDQEEKQAVEEPIVSEHGADAESPKPPALLYKGCGEDDVISRKYAADQECMVLLLEIINEFDNKKRNCGDVRFKVREIKVSQDFQ